MRYLTIFLGVVCLPGTVLGQGTIQTIAGTASCGYSGDGGRALQAALCNPQGAATDSTTGNVFFVDAANWRIRKVDSNGVITTIAGNGVRGVSGDGGAAVNASIGAVTQLSSSGGYVVFGDPDAHKVRYVSLSGGAIQGIGTGNAVSAGDGQSWNAVSFNQPSGVETFVQYAGQGAYTGLYVADAVDNLVRRLDGITGVASTIVGPGTPGQLGDNGPGTAASLLNPAAIRLYNNALYIADAGNHRIRKLDLNTGIITTVAGDGSPAFGGDGGPATAAHISSPAHITFDGSGNMYFTDRGNFRIRKVDTNGIITTFAGNGTNGVGPDNVTPDLTWFGGVNGVAWNPITYGFAIADGSNSIRQALPFVATSTTLATSPNPALPGDPVALTATVSPAAATGAVSFSYGSGSVFGTATLNNGAATLSWTPPSNGMTPIKAIYNGDANYAPSTSAIVNAVVQQGTTTVTIASSQNPSTPGQPVTFTATVSPAAASGAVGFYNYSALLGSGALVNGVATFTTSSLSAGSTIVSAQYGGDSRYAASQSSQITQVVKKATSTILTASPNPATYSAPVNLFAIVTPAPVTGTVQFFNGTALIGSASVDGLGYAFLTTTTLPVGASSITATYPGDFADLASTSSAVVVTIAKANSTTTLSANPTSSAFGQPVTLTAAVNPPSTGTVQFFKGTTLLGTATIANNQAQITTSALPAGNNTVTATYSGDGNTNSSASTEVQVTVAPASTTTTLSASPAVSSFGDSVTLTAAVTPAGATGTVQFLNGSTVLGSAAVNGGQAQISIVTLPVGSNALTASYSGDTNYSSSISAAIQQTVNKAGSATTLSASPVQAAFGQTVTLTATVTPTATTGTVQFFNGATSLGAATVTGGQAQLATTALPAGTASLTATYNGDPNYTASTSSAVSITVNRAATSTALAASPVTSTYGQSVALTATVTPVGATGSVQFVSGATVLGSVTLNGGQAQLTTAALPAGTNSLTAIYSGDASYNPSTSPAVQETVSKVATATVLTSSPSSSTYGQAITLTAAVSPSTVTGAVQFFNGAALLGTATVAGGQAQLVTSALPAGILSLAASYSGDANNAASTSAVLTATVQKASTSTAITSSVNPAVQGQAVTFTASVTPASATGTVTFSGVGSASLTNGVASITTSSLPAGTTTVTAQYNGDANYNASMSAGLGQLVKVATATGLTSSPNPSTFGQSVSLTATVTPSSATGSVQFFNGAQSLGTVALSAGSAILSSGSLPAGSESLTAVYSGDANNAPSTSPVRVQTVSKANSATTLSSSPSQGRVGQTSTFTATVGPATATGTVQFTDNGTVLATVTLSGGTAVFATSSLASGTHPIVAVYSGNTNVNSSQSSVLNYKVH